VTSFDEDLALVIGHKKVVNMASKTKITETRRAHKVHKQGRKRKAHNRNHGTSKTAKELFGD
jgi:hypothetical protein